MTEHQTETSTTQPLVLGGDFETPPLSKWEDLVVAALNRGRPPGKELSVEQAYKRLTYTNIDGIITKPVYTSPQLAALDAAAKSQAAQTDATAAQSQAAQTDATAAQSQAAQTDATAAQSQAAQTDATAAQATQASDSLGLPGVAPFIRGTTVRDGQPNAWNVCQLHEDPNPQTTKTAINTDLATGATALWLRVDPNAIQPGDVAKVLDDVLLDLAPVEVSSYTNQKLAAQTLLDVFAASNVDKAKLQGCLNIDPITAAILQQQTANIDMQDIVDFTHKTADLPGVIPIRVAGDEFHNIGATEVQEIAWTIATGITYVREMVTKAGLTATDAFARITFRLAATTDQFATIAKFRAFRLLWNHVGKTLGIPADKRGATIAAITSWRQISRDDPYVNLLRGTIQTFAAAVGMAEAITVLPFDTAHGLPTDFSRRMARNTQIILAEEANIGRVNDPAGGAYWVEDLTHQLSEQAWQLVAEIETLPNGMVDYCDSMTFDHQLETSRTSRMYLLQTRALPKTGVSEFPNLSEKPLVRVQPDLVTKADGTPLFRKERERETAIFETLRDLSNAQTKRPHVFLACLGERRNFGARETFTNNLFAIAGIGTDSFEGGTPDDQAKAFAQSGTNVAVLCSNKRMYSTQAIETAQALKQQGATTVLLAGSLKEIADTDQAVIDQHIDGTVALGMNVQHFLQETLTTLGAS